MDRFNLLPQKDGGKHQYNNRNEIHKHRRPMRADTRQGLIVQHICQRCEHSQIADGHHDHRTEYKLLSKRRFEEKGRQQSYRSKQIRTACRRQR